MRRITLFLTCLLCCAVVSAQNYNINLHQSGSVIYTEDVNNIDIIRFEGHQPANMLINAHYGTTSVPITAFDSITFTLQGLPPEGDTVYIIYNNSSVNVVNPFANNGVTVDATGANVTVSSTMANVPYVVSGTSTNGSLTVYSTSAFYMALSSLSLTSNSTAAINVASNVNAALVFVC